jgi:hypothetical protein
LPQPDPLLNAEGFGYLRARPNVGPLRQRFVFPPFSVWNTVDDDWQKRRRLWLAKGIKSEEGRAGKLTFNIPMELSDGSKGNKIHSQTSIFDPVICELVYGWWCKPAGIVLDPFAGGSVRGLMASMLGFKYLGIELREEQVEANRAQVTETTRGDFAPRWECGDSAKLLPTLPGRADLVFSCPPYGNLERYSEDPADISTMRYEEFLEVYGHIIKLAVDRLRDDRFACFVVGDYRDKDTGQMRNLEGDTIRAFEAAGAEYYNGIVLINSRGSGAMRANGTFVRGARKVVKSHQNVLVFVKGDPKVAARDIPADAGVNTGEGNTEETNGEAEEV